MDLRWPRITARISAHEQSRLLVSDSTHSVLPVVQSDSSVVAFADSSAAHGLHCSAHSYFHEQNITSVCSDVFFKYVVVDKPEISVEGLMTVVHFLCCWS